jgi:hypothetical protein
MYRMHRGRAITGMKPQRRRPQATTMRLSRTLIDAVEAALPRADEAGIATRAVHAQVGHWNRTTVRHALRELVRQGRAGFSGRDRQRRYRRANGFAPQPMPAQPLPPPVPPPPLAWRDYAARGDGSVRQPDEREVAEAMRRHRIRYRDVGAAALIAEERLPGWSRRPRNSAELTRVVFGDPAPGGNRSRRQGETR